MHRLDFRTVLTSQARVRQRRWRRCVCVAMVMPPQRQPIFLNQIKIAVCRIRKLPRMASMALCSSWMSISYLMRVLDKLRPLKYDRISSLFEKILETFILHINAFFLANFPAQVDTGLIFSLALRRANFVRSWDRVQFHKHN